MKPSADFHILRPSNLSKTYFDFTYHLALSPFRLQRMPDKTGRSVFIVRTWRPQQIICGFNWLFAVFYCLTEIRLNIPKVFNNPMQYFRCAARILNGIMKLLLMNIFWRKGNLLAGILNDLEGVDYSWTSSSEKPETTKPVAKFLMKYIWREWVVVVLGVAYTLIGILNMM